MITAAATIGSTADYQNDYSYDALGRLRRLVQATQGGNAVSAKRVDLTYNPDGQLDTITRYAGTTTNNPVVGSTYGYDGYRRLTSIAQTGLAIGSNYDELYGYDYDNANRVNYFSSDIDGVSFDYRYDARGQLLSANAAGTIHDETYTYNDNGNRAGGYIGVNPDNQIYTDGTYQYAYDAEGNLTTRTEIATGYYRIFTWDNRDRLVAVTDYSDTDDELQSVEYEYDAFNQLVGRKVFSGGYSTAWETQAFVYDGGQAVFEFERSEGEGDLTAANLNHRTLWGPAVDQLLADEQVDWSDSQADGEVFWAMTDAEGSVRDIVDNNGTLRRHAAFDAFGNMKSHATYYGADGEQIEGAQPWEHADAAQSPFLFTGRYFDRNTGLQNNLNRWYDPGLGRWLSQDPMSFAAGDTNLYRYVRNQPTDLTDHTGLGFDHLQGRDDDSWWSWWTDFKRNFVHYANPFVHHHHVDRFDDFAEPAKVVVDVVVVVDVTLLTYEFLPEADPILRDDLLSPEEEALRQFSEAPVNPISGPGDFPPNYDPAPPLELPPERGGLGPLPEQGPIFPDRGPLGPVEPFWWPPQGNFGSFS